MIGVRVAVEYGTEHTVAVLEWPDGRRETVLFDGLSLLPSAVYADGESLLAGRDAARAVGLDPARYLASPRRHVADVEVRLGDRSWPAQLGATVEQLVMTHPGSWGAARRERLATAAVAAGLPAPVLVPAPVAAAGAVPPGRSVVVYHLGAGTFEACVARGGPTGPEPLSHQGADDLGGLTLDAVVAELTAAALNPTDAVSVSANAALDPADAAMTAGAASATGAASDLAEGWRLLRAPETLPQRRAAHQLGADLRAAREALSRQDSAALPVLDREVRVTRQDFERAAEPLLRRTVEATVAAIRQAHVAPADVDALLLVGGASRTPRIAEFLTAATGLTPTTVPSPEAAAALGALTAVSPARLPEPAPTLPPAPMPSGAPTTPLPAARASGPAGRAVPGAMGQGGPVVVGATWRWLVVVGIVVVAVLVVVGSVAVVALWPREQGVGAHGAATASAVPSGTLPASLEPRAGAPHTGSTFGNAGQKVCAGLDYSALADVFGKPVDQTPASVADTAVACVHQFARPGQPSQDLGTREAGVTAPGVYFSVTYHPTPADARKYAADLYRGDAVPGWTDGFRILDAGDLGYTYHPRLAEGSTGTNKVIACVVTGNAAVFVEAISPTPSPAWDTAGTQAALSAVATFVGTNLHLVESP
jgi:hypothetical protein